MPSSPPLLCSSFQRLSKRTWSQLSKARLVNYHPVETGITDSLLIELKRRHPKEVVIFPFSQREEAISGADWEWWFVGNKPSAVGFRIQAKTIHHSSMSYNSLHYRVSKTGMFQADQLIKNARSSSPSTIPLYCLYTEWVRSPVLRKWRCGTFLTPRKQLLGCAIVSPFVVRRMRKPVQQNNLSHLLPYLHPWHCLVCCNGFGGDGLPERAFRFYRGMMFQRDMQSAERDPTDVGQDQEVDELASIEAIDSIDVLPQVPERVTTVLRGGAILPQDANLAGLVIISEP